ncbi:hypothetical protein ACFE04_012326 [Oxalis oulophora]
MLQEIHILLRGNLPSNRKREATLMMKVQTRLTRVRDASDGFRCSGVYGYPSYKHHRDRDASTCDSESSPCRVSSLSSSSKYIGLYFGRSRLGRISSSSGRRVKRIDPYMLQGEVFTIPSRAPRSQGD